MIRWLFRELILFILGLIKNVIVTLVLLVALFVAIKHFAGYLFPPTLGIFTRETPSSANGPRWWEFWKSIPELGRSSDKEEVDARATREIAQNLLVNGEFKDHWSKGWRKETQFDPEAIIQAGVKNGILSVTFQCKFCALSQSVPVNTLRNLYFDGRVKLKGNRPDGLGSIFSMVEVAVDIELFHGNSLLGRFWITNQRPSVLEQLPLRGIPRTVQNQRQIRVIPIEDQWQRIHLNLYQEALDYLVLDPDKVNGVVVSLVTKTSGQGADAEAWVDYLRLYYKENSLSKGRGDS